VAESREKWNFLDGKLVYHFSFEFNLREFIIVSLCCVSFHISDANPVLVSPCLSSSFSFFASRVTTKTSRMSKKSYRRHRSPCFVLCTSEKTSLPSESFLAFVGLRQNGTKKVPKSEQHTQSEELVYIRKFEGCRKSRSEKLGQNHIDRLSSSEAQKKKLFSLPHSTCLATDYVRSLGAGGKSLLLLRTPFDANGCKKVKQFPST
jgi:hypothetical protein